MELRQLAVWILSTVSGILFIRASIVPLFAVYGDPIDELYMSIVSLIFIAIAFGLTARKGSFIAGPIMSAIGAFYTYSGYRLLGLITEEIANDTNAQGLVSANIITIVIGLGFNALGIFSLIRKTRMNKTVPIERNSS